jgi:4-diphosphocytidyl-2-C-methyl-D-erythritol kinase
MESIKLNAHAKINLSLRITGKRPDGYHDIVSFMQGTGLYDVVEMTFCLENGTKYNLPHCTINGIVVYLCTDVKTIPTDMSNLAFKGVKALLNAYRDRGLAAADMPELLIKLDKRLPVAAGIAGGSGNAAACMLGLNALMGNPFSLRELMETGTSVGADVPFSIFMNAYRNRKVLADLKGIEEARDSAWTAGIGDIVEAADPVSRYVILANPGTGVSTKSAYEAMDSIGYSGVDANDRRLFINDFEKYTLTEHPKADRLKRLMQKCAGADEVLMSGSGPTIVAYYKEKKGAETGMKALAASSEDGVKLWQTATGLDS